MKNRQATRMFGMTVMGGITVNGPMFDIHDNQHLHFYNQGTEVFRYEEV